MAIWIQVRDVQFEHERLLAAGVQVIRRPQQEPWGLVEMWVADPDGVCIVLVEVPKDGKVSLRSASGSPTPPGGTALARSVSSSAVRPGSRSTVPAKGRPMGWTCPPW